MHHSIIHIKNIQQDATVYQNFYFVFIWSLACFGRHTAHHQGPKTALAASGFAYVEGCWTCSWWTLSGTLPDNVQQLHVQQPSTHILYLTASSNYTSNNLPLIYSTWQDPATTRPTTFHSYTLPDNVQQLHVQQPSTYAKPEAASAVLGSWWWVVCRPKHVELHINMK